MTQLANQAVFICGYPKSGTTLLVTALDSHPELLVFPEEVFLGKLWRRHRNDDVQTQLRFLKERAFRSFWDTPENRLARLQTTYVEQVDYPTLEAAFLARRGTGTVGGRELTLAVIMAYQDVVQQPGEKRWWVEKSLGNEHSADRFLEWFPEARFIYCVRDPRETYASYKRKRQRFDDSDLPLAEFLSGWRDSLAAGLTLRDRLGVDRVFWMRYEPFVQDPERHLSRLCKFLGINVDPVLLTPTRNGQPWGGNSMHDTTFTRIVDTTARGPSTLPDNDLLALETTLESLMVQQGYANLRIPGRDRIAYRVRQRAAQLWQVAHRVGGKIKRIGR